MSLPSTTTRASAGHVIVRGLAAHGIDRVFVVPGESYLEVLDGLRAGGRSVGIVSHVGELRARIPSQVRLHRTERGSTVEVLRAPEPV